jgi:hypothetical protein
MDSSRILRILIIPLIVYLASLRQGLRSKSSRRDIVLSPDDGMSRKGSWVPSQGNRASIVRVPHWSSDKARRRRTSSTSPSSDTRRIAGLRRRIGRRSRRRIRRRTRRKSSSTSIRSRTRSTWRSDYCIVIAIGLAVIVVIRVLWYYPVLIVGIVDYGYYDSMFE